MPPFDCESQGNGKRRVSELETWGFSGVCESERMKMEGETVGNDPGEIVCLGKRGFNFGKIL